MSQQIKAGRRFLIGAAIGSGSSALAAEHGGADFLLAIGAGRLRNMGSPSISCMLPFSDVDVLTEDFAKEEVLSQCKIPVLLGQSVWGNQFAPELLCEKLNESGFSGAVNFPSSLHYSRAMQQLLSRAGRGIEAEIEQLRAVQAAGHKALFYCANRTQARLAADAGIELICLNLGWNTGGNLGHRSSMTIEEVGSIAREIRRLIRRINPKTRFLLEGGPIATSEDLARVLKLSPLDGYVGGSTFERLPLETSVAEQIHRFKYASRRRAALDREGDRLVAWSRRFGFVGRSPDHVAYLRRLRALAATREPVLLIAEQGVDIDPAIRALSASRAQSKGVFDLSSTTGSAGARLSVALFGQRDAKSHPAPALADAGLGLLIIRAPEQMPHTTQRRLAKALTSGRFNAPASRRELAVSASVVFVCEMATPPGVTKQVLLDAGICDSLADVLVGWTLRAPPLRERIDDMWSLLQFYSTKMFARPLKRSSVSLASQKALQAHRWPGNEMELRRLLGGLAGYGDATEPVMPHDVASLLTQGVQEQEPISGPGIRSEKDRVLDALWRHGFHKTKAAQALGMSRKTLYNKIKKYGLRG